MRRFLDDLQDILNRFALVEDFCENILVGGCPAPGLNRVTSASYLEARSRAHRVIGSYVGFQWRVRGDSSHVKEMDYDGVSRIHFQEWVNP